MSKAFGIITKLDKVETLEHYDRLKNMSIQSFTQAGFKENNIFCVCSIFELYHANRDKLDEEGDKTYKILLKKLKEYQELGFGISDAKEAIKYSVKHELPNKRFLKCQELAEKKMLPLAIEGIEKGRKIIPYSILDEKTLGDQLNTRNIEFWGDIFEKDRFTPAIKNATIWKSKTFIMDKVEHIEKNNEPIHRNIGCVF